MLFPVCTVHIVVLPLINVFFQP